jgi:hypothetical protein
MKSDSQMIEEARAFSRDVDCYLSTMPPDEWPCLLEKHTGEKCPKKKGYRCGICRVAHWCEEACAVLACGVSSPSLNAPRARVLVVEMLGTSETASNEAPKQEDPRQLKIPGA